MGITRRDFLNGATAMVAGSLVAQSAADRTRLGIASTSLSGPRNALDFLERCSALGSGGIQTQLNADPAKLRARAEQLGMYVEGMASLPRDGNAAAFEKALQDSRASGATVVRIAALSGRRYETFSSADAWSQWKEQTFAALKLAVPIAEKLKIKLALENHKDWTIDDQERLLKSYSSEYLGVCLDFGNNIAMLEDPMETIERLTPYAFSTHVKDMGVQPYEDGFLLSEVPLGQGILDLPRIIAMVQKAQPSTRFSLEMMTRDPLKVPCLTDKYWAPFPDRNGRYLARTLKLVRDHAARNPLPMVSQMSNEDRARLEEDNVKTCLRYAKEKLSL